MVATNENIRAHSNPGRSEVSLSEVSLSRDVSLTSSEVAPQLWHDPRKLKVSGMGTGLPGRPVTTSELLTLMEDRFSVAVSRRGATLPGRLKIATRHICRDRELGEVRRSVLAVGRQVLEIAYHLLKNRPPIANLERSPSTATATND